MVDKSVIPTFNPDDKLIDVRVRSLNPVILRVNTLETLVNNLPDSKIAYKDAKFLDASNQLLLTSIDDKQTLVDLSNLYNPFLGITVRNETGIKKLDFTDAGVTVPREGEATVKYNWHNIVPIYQRDPEVVIIDKQPSEYSTLKVAGSGSKYFTATAPTGVEAHDGVLKIDLPEIYPRMEAKVTQPGGTATCVPITHIHVAGNVGASQIDGEVLNIDLPEGGGPPSTYSRYFEGFFNSEDDLKAAVTDPITEKSSAYVKTINSGVEYYALFMYIVNEWKRAVTKPGLLYNSIPTQGITSVKKDDHITLSTGGELDLSGLYSPPLDRWFMGSYNTTAEIRAIPNPTAEKSFAIHKNGNNPQNYLFGRDPSGGGKAEWRLTPALSHLMFVTTNSTINSYKPIYGIRNNPSVTLDEEGTLSVKLPEKPEINFNISDATGSSTTGKFSTLKLDRGKSLASSTDGTLTVQHPQQVIVYNKAWDGKHTSKDYRGNIFYDEATGNWMGMTDKNIADDEPRWTPVAHREMSAQVKDQNYRHPKHTPTVHTIPSSAEDPRWLYTGMTYVEKEDASLPSVIKSVCGGYIQTNVKEDPTDGPIPKNRLQTCHADDGSGKTFARSYDSTNNTWREWTLTSFSKNLMDDHENDIGAHKNIIKFHKVNALTGHYNELMTNVVGSLPGGLTSKNLSLLSDSYGLTEYDQDFVKAPYTGKFRIKGCLSFAGYGEWHVKGDTDESLFPTGVWEVRLRGLKEGATTPYDIAKFTHIHSDYRSKFPLLDFLADNVNMSQKDKLFINITFTGALGYLEDSLYLVPLRSYLVIEDCSTHAGTLIGNSHRHLYGNLDVMGGVGLRVTKTRSLLPDPVVRVYSEEVVRNPTSMTKTN